MLGEDPNKNDSFLPGYTTATNHSGGIQGGISNGQDIVFRVAFKPVATILQPQSTIDVNGEATTLDARGRHDACVLPRAVPIVEAMAALTLADAYLVQKQCVLSHNPRRFLGELFTCEVRLLLVLTTFCPILDRMFCVDC